MCTTVYRQIQEKCYTYAKKIADKEKPFGLAHPYVFYYSIIFSDF